VVLKRCCSGSPCKLLEHYPPKLCLVARDTETCCEATQAQRRKPAGARDPEVPNSPCHAHPTPINSMATSGRRLMNFARSCNARARLPTEHMHAHHIPFTSCPCFATHHQGTNSQLLITSLVGSTDHSLHGLIL
jgi:hypothetical protein